jgi:hypothetical protein
LIGPSLKWNIGIVFKSLFAILDAGSILNNKSQLFDNHAIICSCFWQIALLPYHRLI